MRFIRNLLARLEDSVIRKGNKKAYRGIIFCDVNLDDSDDQEFFRITGEAIDLIAQVDPRRFKRVKKELKYIINNELLSGGQYSRRLNACVIDFGRYKFAEDYQWYLYDYAGTIIHEATHGFLYTKGFEYTPKNRVQTEKICRVEENRFFAKLDYEFKDQLIKPFDEKDWNFSWHASKWNQMKALLQRLKQSVEKNKKVQLPKEEIT